MEDTNTMDTVYTSSWTLVPNPLLPRYRLKDGAQGAEWTVGAHQLEHAGAALQTQVSPALKCFWRSPPWPADQSLLWSVSTPSLVLPSGCLPNICPPPARLFHGLSCPALKVPWDGVSLPASGPHPMRLLPLCPVHLQVGGSCSSWFLLWSSAA